MSKGTSRSKREREAANFTYFVSLASSRGSLTNLPVMALVALPVLGLEAPFLGSMVFYAGHHVLLPLFCGHLVLIGFSVLVFVLSAPKSLSFRFQVSSSVLLTIFALVWVYMLTSMAVLLAVLDVGVAGTTEFSGTRLYVAGIVAPLYVCVAFLVHALLLRKRLREGHSEKRTMGNYLAASSVFSSKSLWIIFGVAVIGPNLLTGGQYVMATVGVLLFLLFASVVTSLPVEFGYLAYLKARDKRYWEERPPKDVRQKGQGWKALWKVVKWVLIVVAAFIALSLLPLIWPDS